MRQNFYQATLFALSLTMIGCADSKLGDGTYDVPLSCGSDCIHEPSADGTGAAVVVGATGQVDITVQDLPMLTDEVYEGWLAGGGESPISTG